MDTRKIYIALPTYTHIGDIMEKHYSGKMDAMSVRRRTKIKTLNIIETAPMPVEQLAANLCEFNDYTMKTNITIIRELAAVGKVIIDDGVVERVENNEA